VPRKITILFAAIDRLLLPSTSIDDGDVDSLASKRVEVPACPHWRLYLSLYRYVWNVYLMREKKPALQVIALKKPS